MTALHSKSKPSRFIRPVPAKMSHIFKAVFFLALIVITFESLIPPIATATPTQHDKLLHFAAYAVLMTLAGLAFPKARLINLAVFLFAVGGAIEIVQSLMGQGRDGNLGDQLANMSGVICPILLWLLIKKLRS